MRPIDMQTYLSWTFIRSYDRNGKRVEVREDENGKEWEMEFALPPSHRSYTQEPRKASIQY